MRMLPHEKALVERLQDHPFTMIGINSDPSGALEKRIKNAGITWPIVLDGSHEGPIHKRWNITYWPAIFVLDGKGVIRFKNLRGEALDKGVESLLGEIETRK